MEFKGKPVHTGLYLVRKGMRLDGATLSLFKDLTKLLSQRLSEATSSRLTHQFDFRFVTVNVITQFKNT
jgi:hypothetical protein